MLLRFVLLTTLVFSLSFAARLAAEDYDSQTTPAHPALVAQEFIYTDAPFEQCHASTILETPDGLLAAWFGGKHEKNPDVEIWSSRHDGESWSPVESIAHGIQNDELRYPCWNPILTMLPSGEVVLFYKVGPSPSEWWGEFKSSRDYGQTWSESTKLPDGFLGPVKNKAFTLSDGSLLLPTSTEHDGWRVHIERVFDRGDHLCFTKTDALNDGKSIGAIQPSILNWNGRLQILCRSQQKKIAQAWSDDGGETWSEMTLTDLPNPNSGTDAVTLADGRGVLIYNDTPRGRSPLNVAISSDGNEWKNVLKLEDKPGEYSYPAVIQTADGKVHVTYTWKRRRVKHVVLDPEKF